MIQEIHTENRDSVISVQAAIQIAQNWISAYGNDEWYLVDSLIR
jgi:hypothetical protein